MLNGVVFTHAHMALGMAIWICQLVQISKCQQLLDTLALNFVDIHGVYRTNPTEFGNPLTFPQGPPFQHYRPNTLVYDQISVN